MRHYYKVYTSSSVVAGSLIATFVSTVVRTFGLVKTLRQLVTTCQLLNSQDNENMYVQGH